MKLILIILSLLSPSILFAAPSSLIRQGPKPIDANAHGVGRWVPDISFTSIDGKKGRLSDFKEYKALVIAFTGASCPISKRFAPSLSVLEHDYSKKGIAFLFVDPIAMKSASKALHKMVDQIGFDGPFILDQDKSLSKILGVKTTTEAFILDAARTLLYRGPVSDQYGIGYQLSEPRNQYLRDTLDAILQEREIANKAMWSPGCELDLEYEGLPVNSLTYHNRISRILENNCVECHRTDGVGPFSLEHYDEAEGNAGMIRKVVSEGIMPPWFASDPPHGHPSPWANDRSLSSSDKRDLLDWIKNGKPEGNPAHALLPMVRNNEWNIGKPDAIFSLPKEINIKATGQMPYVNLRVKTKFAEDRWIEAAEIRPTAKDTVHHVLVVIDDQNGIRGGIPRPLAAYVPGNSYFEFPSGVAKKLPAGANLFFQLHYTPTGQATTDRTRLGLRFAKHPPQKVVQTIPVANRKIKIPANDGNHIETAFSPIPKGTMIRAYMPHMHLRGKAFKYELLTQDGQKKTLLEVPHYDFNWQLRYELKEPRPIPVGSRIQVTGVFDNSKENPANPDPDITVDWGDQSEDEMLIGYLECEFEIGDGWDDTDQENSDLFTQLDKNHDGFLTKNEFDKPELFPFFDNNKDGRVCWKEGSTGMVKIKARQGKKRKENGFLKSLLDQFR